MHAHIRPYSVVLWILFPLWLLTILVLYPFHNFDLWVSHLFFVDGAWLWKSNILLEDFFHKNIKWLPILFLTFYFLALFKEAKKGNLIDRHFSLLKACYVISAVLLSLGLVWWLKQITGVSCPWSVTEFGGTKFNVSPSFSWSFREGQCWPGGHAGTGFCLFSLYFVNRDDRPVLARILLVGIVALGVLCSAIRVMQGAHFFTHNVATLLIDWLVSALLYIVVFDRFHFKQRCADSLDLTISQRNVFTALLWVLVYSAPFWMRLLESYGKAPDNIVSNISLVVALVASFLFISLAFLQVITIFPFRIQQLFLGVLALCGSVSFVSYQLYGTFMTPDMVRNFLETDFLEISMYYSSSSVTLGLLMIGPGLLLALQKQKRGMSWLERCQKVGLFAAFLFIGGLILLSQLQPFSALMRNEKNLRYLIAPFNVVYSLGTTVVHDQSAKQIKKKEIFDLHPKALVQQSRPSVFVLVIGETARSDNWQLAGYSRETNPNLFRENIISIPRVKACGTSTDISLPCMLSRVGRRDYDRERILSEESLPALLQRAGFDVIWVDNQSGSKGTSVGVKTVRLKGSATNCPNGQCMDAVFVDDLKNRLNQVDTQRPQVLIYHMMGSHGPAYDLRSDKQDKVFGKVCSDPSFMTCKNDSIINAYDASLRYTDRVLSGLIKELKKHEAVNTGLLYVSDHGESLGEGGLYLHGAPYYFAPDNQKEVPMVMWFSNGFEKEFDVSTASIRETSKKVEVTHDHLYHTVLGLLRVQSTAYEAKWDLSAKVNG